MHGAVFNLAVVAYVCAAGLALAHLVRRDELLYRLTTLATVGGWGLHSIALVLLGAQRGRPPFETLPSAVSVAVWVVVLGTLWVERQSGLRVLGAFVLPVVTMLSISAVAQPLTLPVEPALRGAWLWVHIALALIGIAAFILNFAGAIMYLLQERQLRVKRPGAFYYRLPALETLDRLTYRALALGFPFLTVGLMLGVVWARTAWGSVFAFDPLAGMSAVAWVIYAATLAGRAAVGWHGRRAAYFSLVGFAVLVLTLGAGLFIPGKHGAG